MAKGIASAVAVLSLIAGILALDARYWKVQAGEAAVGGVAKTVEKLALSVEELRLKNEIATARARVQFLAAKPKPTADEQEELAFVRSQISVQQKQLLDVQAMK